MKPRLGRRFLGALALLLTLGTVSLETRAAAATESAAEPVSRLERHTVDSPALGRAVAYTLYTPAGHASVEGLPILHLLHGLGGSEHDWRKLGRMQGIADAAIADGAIPPIAIAMPDADNSWYVNSDAHGPWETAFREDILPGVETRHGVRTDRGGRFIAGLSMGGYGALRIAFRDSSRFRAVASFSGAIFPDVQSPLDFSKTQRRFFKGAFGEPLSVERFNRENFYHLIPDLPRGREALGVWLSVGDHDGFRLYEGTLALFLSLKAAKRPVELRVVDGNHHWSVWRAELARALAYFGSLLETDRQSKASD